MKATILFSALAILSGCASNVPPKPENEPPRVADRPAAAPVDVGIDWDWRVVGDAAARPVQVFGLKGQTYVQMRDRRPVVLLVNGSVVPFLISWPYLVIQGQPDSIDIVIDGYRAVAERVSPSVQREPVGAPDAAASGNRVERVKLN